MSAGNASWQEIEPDQFAAAILTAAEQLGVLPLAVEKDYWACAALRAITSARPGEVIFKGGTSLEKLRVIRRFSEDLDLLIVGDYASNRAAERALSALFEQLGKGWSVLADRDPDLRYVVRELHIEFLAQVQSPGSLLIELAATRIGRTSATHRFRCASPDGAQTLASGYRVIVKIDEAGQPVPWSSSYRDEFARLGDAELAALAAPEEGAALRRRPTCC